MTRADVLTVGPTTLITEECCACGVTFAMPETLHDNLRRITTGGSFYCPNGHPQHYTGKSANEKLEEVRREALSLRQRLDQAEADAARKGKQLATLKRRIKAGLCPECNRHFTNLERHIASKHSSQSGESRT